MGALYVIDIKGDNSRREKERAGWHNEYFSLVGILIFLGLLLIPLQDALCVDELYLTGFIKSYDREKGFIWVDVRSESCRGVREFKVPESVRADLEPSLIGQEISFFIDSSKCEPGRVYNMLLRRR